MNKDKGSKSKESTPRNEQDDMSGRRVKSLSQSEGPESWSNAESSVGSSGRRRPSSWDDSDDESPSTTINSFNHKGLIYSGGSPKQAKSVASEINDIKTQYFKNLDAVEGLSHPRNSNFDAKTCKNVENVGEIRSESNASDRRQSPARIRRRTKSSSSSTAVLEPTIECNSSENKENFQIFKPESYQYKTPRHYSCGSENPPLNAELEFDSNYFLNHIFTEVHAKRIGLVSLCAESSLGKESRERKMLDLKSCSGSNMEVLKSHDLARTFPSLTHNPDLKTLESFESEEPTTFIHRTSRKLSLILEVEETKKSQEKINLLEEEGGVELFEMSPFLWANSQKPLSPFLTSNDEEGKKRCWTSVISLREQAESPTVETVKLSPKNSGSLEKLGEQEKPETFIKERLSQRLYNFFPYRDSDNDNIIFLTEKTGKTQLGSNSDQEEVNNCGWLKDSEKVKHLDELERETSWENLEMENVNPEGEKADVEENPALVGKNNSSARQKKLRPIKTPNSEVEKKSQEARIPNVEEETMLSWSDVSTPRRNSRDSLRKSSKREREPGFQLEIECSSLQPQRLTSRSLKIEEITSDHSSRESSHRLKDEYINSTSGETSKGSSQRTCDNLNPETAERRPNFLTLDLEKVCSDSSTSTESNSSSSRTFAQEEIKDWSFRTNSPGQSPKSSHTSEPPKNRSSKKIRNYFSDSSDPNRLRMNGNKTDRHSRSQKMSSPSLISSEGNFEKKTDSSVKDALKIREKETSANSEWESATAAKRKPSKTYETRSVSRNSTNNCNSAVSEGTGVSLAQLQDVIGNLESTTISRQRENYTFYDDVTMTVKNIISEEINSSRSEKTGKKWKNDKGFGRNEVGVSKGLYETRSEDRLTGEDFKTNLLSIQTKDVIQDDSENCKKYSGTVRNTVTSGQFSEDVISIEESETFLDEKSSLSPSSTKAMHKELTKPMEHISYSLEKMEIDSDKSVRESEGTETEGNHESRRSGRTRKLSNEGLSITCEKWEESTVNFKLFSGQTSNRTAISNISSEATEKHMLSDISEPGSYRNSRTEGSQTPNKELKSTNSKISFQKCPGHETSKESVTPKPIFQNKFSVETWNRLIDTFEGTQKSDHSSENKFPGFPSLNQKEFTENDREETQDYFLYEPDEPNESEDFFTLSRRIIEGEGKPWLRSPKDREHKGNKCETVDLCLLPESINSQLEHSEGRIILKNNGEKSVNENDSKRKNFEIGEFGDGNYWHDGKPDISEPEKPQHHGDGNQERRNNWETLILMRDANKETKSGRHTWMEVKGKALRPNPPKNKSFSGKENNADLEAIFISHSLNHSKSENSFSKMWSQQGENESKNFKTSTNTGPMKGSTKKKSDEDSVLNSRTGDCLEESSCEEREYQVGKCYSSDESRLIYGKNGYKNFERLDTVTSEMGNRKQEKESTNLNIFLAGHKKEKALVKSNNWLIIKNQEGKQSREQKEKIRKLKKKLKKCEKLNSSKEPLYIDENATGKMPAFVPTLKFSNTGCLQNFYKRLFSICCLTSNSSAATSS